MSADKIGVCKLALKEALNLLYEMLSKYSIVPFLSFVRGIVLVRGHMQGVFSRFLDVVSYHSY